MTMRAAPGSGGGACSARSTRFMSDNSVVHHLLSRWSRGLRLLAVAWFGLLLYAWLRRHADASEVLLFGALPAALYWTLAHALLRMRRGK